MCGWLLCARQNAKYIKQICHLKLSQQPSRISALVLVILHLKKLTQREMK